MLPYEDIYRKEQRPGLFFRRPDQRPRQRTTRERQGTGDPGPADLRGGQPATFRRGHSRRRWLRRLFGPTVHAQVKPNRWLSIFSLFVGAGLLLVVFFVLQQYRQPTRLPVEPRPLPKAEPRPVTDTGLNLEAKLAVWRRLPDILAQHENLLARQQFELAEERLRAALGEKCPIRWRCNWHWAGC